MKRFVIFLLLCWMPVQACLAAFEEAHAHHDHGVAHFTHASEFHSPHEGSGDDPASDAHCATDCVTSHLCAAQLLFVHTTRATPLAPSALARFDATRVALHALAPERPERPQWRASSH